MIAAVVAAPSDVAESRLLRATRWALVATAAGMPLYVVRWHYGPLPTTLLETLIVVTVATYVVARWRDGWRRPLSTWFDIPIAALLVAGAISVIVAADRRGALGLYRAYFVEPVAIFYVAIDLLRQGRTLAQTIAGFAAGSSVLALLNLRAFAQALLANNIQVTGPPNAVYGDANYVAMFLEPAAAMAVGFLLFARGRWRWLGAVWLAISALALMATLSKIALLAIVVLGAATIATQRRWRWPLVAAFFVAGIVVSQLPLVKERWSTAVYGLFLRLDIYASTAFTLREHPIFGVGLGGFQVTYRTGSVQQYPHDVWLSFWVETGLLGLVAFGVIFFGLLWRGWKAWPTTAGMLRPALWGAMLGMVMWAVHGLFDTPYFKNDMSVEFWIIAAAAWCAISSSRAGEAPAPSAARVERGLRPSG